MQLDLLAALERGLAGHYAVTREIGRGGMAVVYECRDLIAERDVAIKLLYPDLARAVGGARFLREIRILQQLSHPNILPLLDSGTIELLPGLSVPWYAMPLAREETLRARLGREGALPLATALGYARDLSAALAHAHGRGVVHRDIKPENILLVEGHAVLADFGIARAITLAGGDTLSTTGIVVGTPAYMSPEQSTGAQQLDGRSDLYSLGVVLYEMLAGHAPFTGSTPQAISARHQFETPPPIAVVRPGLPAGVTALLERALAKLAADRFQSAGDLAEALQAPQLIAPTRPWTRSIYARAAAAVLVIALAVTATLGLRRANVSAALDPLRYVILPFVPTDSLSGKLLDGGDSEELVADILSRIPDHRLVSTLTVGSRLAAESDPLTLPRALRVTRELGAGRLIWGRLQARLDTVRITASLYDVGTGGELTSASIQLSLSSTTIAELAQRFADLTYRLVLPGESPTETASGVLAAKSMESWRLYAAGDSAFNAWDFQAAEARYRAALVLDPDYPNANLKLAQLREWADADRDEWLGPAEKAFRSRHQLNAANRLLASALFAMGEGRFPDACRAYRGLIAMDTLSFHGWFGLGQCLTRDNALVPDSTRPEAWRFRSSYRQGINAYRHGLTLVPAAHRAYGGAALGALVSRMAATPTFLRVGRTMGPKPESFAAFPSLENDTLAFVPRPAQEVIGTGHYPSTWGRAIEQNRQTLLSVTSLWLNRFPDSPKARETHAEAQEVAGNLHGTPGSALELTRAIRKDNTFRYMPGVLAREARLLVKLGRFDDARAVAESALAVSPRNTEDGVVLAGLAALIGRGDRAADLLGEHGERIFATPGGDLVELDTALARDANRLLVYAGMGNRPDSLVVIRDRILTRAATISNPTRRESLIAAALFRPSMIGFPTLVPRSRGAYRLLTVLALIHEGKAGDGLDLLRTIVAGRSPQSQASFPPDFALLEARLYRLAGDHEAAAHRLGVLLGSLKNLDSHFSASPTQAAAIGRALVLRDSMNPPSVGTPSGSLWVSSAPAADR